MMSAFVGMNHLRRCCTRRVVDSNWRTFTTTRANAQSRVVYHGGFDNILRILKRVSIFSCTCTLVGVPLLAVSSNNPRIKGVQKWVVAFVVVAFGITTTVALHIVAKPYVAKLMLDGSGELMTIETMNMFGRTKTTKMEFSKVVPSDKPWATFGSALNPRLSFFVEEAPDAYRDQQFRERLFAKLGKNHKSK